MADQVNTGVSAVTMQPKPVAPAVAPAKDSQKSDLQHDRGGPNDSAEIDKMKRDAANPRMPFDTRTDDERARGVAIPLPGASKTPGATKKDGVVR